MREAVTVREHARLTTDSVAAPTLDRAHIPRAAFDWLCTTRFLDGLGGQRLVQVDDSRTLQVGSHVGVVEAPDGTRIEILPKTHEAADDAASARRLLRRMISVALEIPARQAGETDLELVEASLAEWVIGRFLTELRQLVQRGLRLDYRRVEESTRYLRGQLDVTRQLRRLPGRQHEFDVRHDIFVIERPENRLLRLALDKVACATKSPSNWRLAHEMRTLLRDIPPSARVDADLAAWRSDRLMAHYQPVRPWCELVLRRQMPHSLVGAWHGVSLLFPMEKLFERFVAACLRRDLPQGVTLRTQAASEHLCSHLGERMFRLEPDLLVEAQGRRWLLDTKWKRLDPANRAANYGISQGDMYQLYAYGMKYLGGEGELALIYPGSDAFIKPLPPFSLGHRLTLHVLPFNLSREQLVGSAQASLPPFRPALAA